ncbi:MAG: hypothetical protein ACRD9L_12580 [Bryobacteraceae bacterium]
MLKIGTVKWQGKCPKHPMFDPESGGAGAIKGGCTRCQDLQKIFESHQRTLGLMRAYGPGQQARRRPAEPIDSRQQDLFGPAR